MSDILSAFPFLSIVKYLEEELVGIILNSDDEMLSFYDFATVKASHKEEFLKHGDNWWNESNRLLPISIFVGEEMRKFRYCIKNIPRKDIEDIVGPCTSLNDILQRRVKRRHISLVKKQK